uniref:Uncharacterized protein n=1 Tax=Glossina palpalis gambiensis TaxID=67801 RepID=A0A1B0C4L7_9MUSC
SSFGRLLDFAGCCPDFAKEAVTKALSDVKIPYTEVQQAAVGYVYGDSTCGQRAVYEVAMTATPVYNVNNNCSTGASALYLAKQIVESGNADCVLALGFEKMQRGSLSSKYFDRANPMERHVTLMSELAEIGTGHMAAQIFGNAGKEHLESRSTLLKLPGKITNIRLTIHLESNFKDRSLIKLAGYDMTKLAASRLFPKSNCKPSDVQVVELHDCFSTNELIIYEALKLCKERKAAELIDSGENQRSSFRCHWLGSMRRTMLATEKTGRQTSMRLYRLGFPASVNIKFNLTSAASTIIEGFKVTPLLKLLEQAMMKDQENLIEEKFEVEMSGRNRRTRGGAVPDRTRKSGRSYERTFAQRQCELIIGSDS